MPAFAGYSQSIYNLGVFFHMNLLIGLCCCILQQFNILDKCPNHSFSYFYEKYMFVDTHWKCLIEMLRMTPQYMFSTEKSER